MIHASPDKIFVISDLHFGESDALLRVEESTEESEGRARVDGLVEWLAYQGTFRQIVLLGDVWELWTSSLTEAFKASQYFFSRLSDIDVEEIIYLPGNHDHHLLVQHQLVEQIMAMRDDRYLEVPARTQRVFEDSHIARILPEPLRERFTVAYPDHFASVGGKQIVFHHGHHSAALHQRRDIFGAALLFFLQRLEEIGLRDLARSDLELAGTIFFELMYAASYGRRTRQKMNDTWERWLAFQRRFSKLAGFLLAPIRVLTFQRDRGTPTQDVTGYHDAVAQLLKLAEEEHHREIVCDAFVFGHTHRAGIARHTTDGGGTRILANAGTWLYEPAKMNRSNEATFLIIDPDNLVLYRQGSDLSVRPLDIEPWERLERNGNEGAPSLTAS